MDLFGRLKKLDTSLQRGLDNGFARAFGGEIVPAEIDESLKQQAEDSVMADAEGAKLAPCVYVVIVSEKDYGSLTSQRPHLHEELSDRLGRYIRNQGWSVNASVQVQVEPHRDLHTGQLRVYSRFDAPEDTPVAMSEQTGYSDSGFEDSNPGYDDEAFTGQHQAIDISLATARSDLANIIQPAHPPHSSVQAEPPASYPGTEVIAQSFPDRTFARPESSTDNESTVPSVEVVLSVKNGSGQTYILKEGSNIIGRGNGVDMRIADSGVSRNHAEIAWDGFDAVLTDLQSTNGTSVNDISIENWLLADKDVIVMGHTEVEVTFRG